MGDCIFHGGFEWSQAAFFQGSQNGDNQVYGVMEPWMDDISYYHPKVLQFHPTNMILWGVYGNFIHDITTYSNLPLK
jgi:hypothetical protein